MSAPENTLAAMRVASARGASWVEFDVHLTKDNIPIVIHDNDLSSTTNGTGEITNTLCEKALMLDAGSWFSPAFAGERVPTLEQMIACLMKCHLCANIELKCYQGNDALVAKQVFAVTKRLWSPNTCAPLFSSFSVSALQVLRQLSNDALIGVLFDAWEPAWETIAEELRCVSVHIFHENLTLERVKAIISTGRQVLAYTVDDKARADVLFSWGVAAVFTNYPDLLAN